LCGIKISAVHHLDLSQATRVPDGQTDGQTDRITTPKTALAHARAVITTASICLLDRPCYSEDQLHLRFVAPQSVGGFLSPLFSIRCVTAETNYLHPCVVTVLPFFAVTQNLSKFVDLSSLRNAYIFLLLTLDSKFYR